jgi:hypothetical protein
MGAPQRIDSEIKTLLRRHRFALVAQNKHYKFQNPEGRVFVCAKTPSDLRAWRNSLTTLKRVIAAPVPSSMLLEEERQRRELEKQIAISAQERQRKGAAGPSRTNGIGFFYYDKRATDPDERPAAFIPDEVTAAEITRHHEQKWNGVISHVKAQVKQVKRDLGDLYALHLEAYRIGDIRRDMAQSMKEVREGRDTFNYPAYRKDFLANRAAHFRNFTQKFYEPHPEAKLVHPGEQLYDVALRLASGFAEIPCEISFANESEAEKTLQMSVARSKYIVDLWWYFASNFLTLDGYWPKPQPQVSRVERLRFRRYLRQAIKRDPARFEKFTWLIDNLVVDPSVPLDPEKLPATQAERVLRKMDNGVELEIIDP